MTPTAIAVTLLFRAELETVADTQHVLSRPHSSLRPRGAQDWGVWETYENGDLENSFRRT